MDEEKEISVKRQIRNLVFLISASVLSAMVLAGSLIMYYGPSGTYAARDVLLSPQVISIINYNDTHPSTGAVTRFVFDSIEFSYFDVPAKRWNKIQVGMEEYAKLYELLIHDRSVSPVTEEMMALFNKANPATLSVRVKPENDKSALHPSKVFQQVVFVNEGDDYRVELREGQQQDVWAYYHHPQIYQNVIKLLLRD